MGSDGDLTAFSWEFDGDLPSGNLLHSELERSTMFNGKIHYFYGHFQ